MTTTNCAGDNFIKNSELTNSVLVVGDWQAILDFWMDQGVDGFRMDAVHYMVEHIDIPDEPKIPNYVKRSGNSDLLEYDSLEHIYTLDRSTFHRKFVRCYRYQIFSIRCCLGRFYFFHPTFILCCFRQ